jgi:hypothetical protein
VSKCAKNTLGAQNRRIFIKISLCSKEDLKSPKIRKSILNEAFERFIKHKLEP